MTSYSNCRTYVCWKQWLKMYICSWYSVHARLTVIYCELWRLPTLLGGEKTLKLVMWNFLGILSKHWIHVVVLLTTFTLMHFLNSAWCDLVITFEFAFKKRVIYWLEAVHYVCRNCCSGFVVGWIPWPTLSTTSKTKGCWHWFGYAYLHLCCWALYMYLVIIFTRAWVCASCIISNRAAIIPDG